MISKKEFEERKDKFLSDYLGELISETANCEQDIHFVFDGEHFRTYWTTQRKSWDRELCYISTIEDFGLPDSDCEESARDLIDRAFVEFLSTDDFDEASGIVCMEIDVEWFYELDIPDLKRRMKECLDGGDCTPEDTSGIVSVLLSDPKFAKYRANFELVIFKESLWDGYYGHKFEHVYYDIENFTYGDYRKWEKNHEKRPFG